MKNAYCNRFSKFLFHPDLSYAFLEVGWKYQPNNQGKMDFFLFCNSLCWRELPYWSVSEVETELEVEGLNLCSVEDYLSYRKQK